MMFADANAFCGIGSLYDDASRTGNDNDGRYASYSRIDANCWSSRSSSVPAHELTHNLGGVLATAPACNHARPLLRRRRHHVLRRRVGHPDAAHLRGGAGAAARLQPRRLLQHQTDRRIVPREQLEHRELEFLDTSLTSRTPPDVAMSASRGTAETGDPVMFTATSSKTVRWTWSKSANASACNLALGEWPSHAGLPVQRGRRRRRHCDRGRAGRHRDRLRVCHRDDGHGCRAVGHGQRPDGRERRRLDAGDVTPVGKAPFRYTWQAGPCAIAASTSPPPRSPAAPTSPARTSP